MFEFHLSKVIRKKRVKIYFKENIEPQEIFLDALAQKKERELGISEKKLETLLSRNILKIFFIFILITNCLFLLRSFQFQVIEGKEFIILSERNKFTIYQLKAERGVIYDKNGDQLVWNKPSFDLILNKNFLPKSEFEKTKIFKEISSILNKNFNEFKEEIENNEDNEILILRNLPHQTLIILEAKIGDFPGFQIKDNMLREYKDGSIFSHLIGYTGKITAEELKTAPELYTIFDWVGKSGLEKSYEEILRKNPGKLRIEKDVKGNIVSQEIVSFPEPGKSLVLWLDSGLQKKIREELEKTIKFLGAKGGVGVAIDPRTGGILSLVSLPDFNNNLFQGSNDKTDLKKILDNPQKPLLNRVISGRYLTGSTIKPLIAAAALEEEIIDSNKQVYTKGFIEVPHRYNPKITYIFKDWTNHGWVDMRKAIAQSCNVYFYMIGGGYGEQKGLGPTKIKEYLKLFGWTEKTGIDLPNEAAGFVPDPVWKKQHFKRKEEQVWLDGDTYYLSIGQQYLEITPLEVATAFSAIANGGRLLQPRVVQKIIDSKKNIVEEFDPRVIRENFIKPENLRIVREGMRQAVTGINSPHASSVILNSLPVSSAAKTGTAELGNGYYHNWATVFAPYEDPQIVLTVMIEGVKTQAAALPVVKEVLSWYFTR